MRAGWMRVRCHKGRLRKNRAVFEDKYFNYMKSELIVVVYHFFTNFVSFYLIYKKLSMLIAVEKISNIY